jgi:hypothetical protein
LTRELPHALCHGTAAHVVLPSLNLLALLHERALWRAAEFAEALGLLCSHLLLPHLTFPLPLPFPLLLLEPQSLRAFALHLRFLRD